MHRLLFMGTPAFAVPSLKALATYPGGRVVGVITQPGRPVGRGLKVRPSAVQAEAETLGLPVFTPGRIGDAEGLALLRELGADLGIVCAYGQILSQAVLDAPPLGWFNLHFSLLPRWRGASPVQAAILAGDAVTGVSLQRVVKKLDAGPIVAETAPMPIAPDDTGETLGGRLSEASAELLAANVAALVSGNPPLAGQDEARVTVCRTIPKQAGAVNWEREGAAEIERKVRAYTPWPGCFGFLGKRRLGLVRVAPAAPPPAVDAAPPGTILPGGWVVAREGALRLVEVKPEGKGAMSFQAFLNGAPGTVGMRLTPEPAA